MNKILLERNRLFRERFPNLNDSTEEGGYDARQYVEDFNSETAGLMVEEFVQKIEEFAHKEMKDGNFAYEKLLILLKNISSNL